MWTGPPSQGQFSDLPSQVQWCCQAFCKAGGRVEDLGSHSLSSSLSAATAAAKSLQSYPTLCDPIDGSPPGSPVPGILQARTLEWVAIFFSSAWKWKVKVKSLSRVRLSATPWTAAYQAPPSLGFSRQEYWSGCHCLLCLLYLPGSKDYILLNSPWDGFQENRSDKVLKHPTSKAAQTSSSIKQREIQQQASILTLQCISQDGCGCWNPWTFH